MDVADSLFHQVKGCEWQFNVDTSSPNNKKKSFIDVYLIWVSTRAFCTYCIYILSSGGKGFDHTRLLFDSIYSRYRTLTIYNVFFEQ